MRRLLAACSCKRESDEALRYLEQTLQEAGAEEDQIGSYVGHLRRLKVESTAIRYAADHVSTYAPLFGAGAELAFKVCRPEAHTQVVFRTGGGSIATQRHLGRGSEASVKLGRATDDPTPLALHVYRTFGRHQKTLVSDPSSVLTSLHLTRERGIRAELVAMPLTAKMAIIAEDVGVMNGTGLRDRIKEMSGATAKNAAIAAGLQVLDDLSQLQISGTAYSTLDVKPDNLVLSADGRVFNCDLASAHPSSESVSPELTTPLYRPPEGFVKDTVQAGSVDPFSWAVTAVELFHGYHPYAEVGVVEDTNHGKQGTNLELVLFGEISVGKEGRQATEATIDGWSRGALDTRIAEIEAWNPVYADLLRSACVLDSTARPSIATLARQARDLCGSVTDGAAVLARVAASAGERMTADLAELEQVGRRYGRSPKGVARCAKRPNLRAKATLL